MKIQTIYWIPNSTGPEIIKLFSCSTQLSIKFQLLKKTELLKNTDFLAYSYKLYLLSDVAFSMLINVKMSTIVGILTFMSMINFCSVEHKKVYHMTSRLGVK